MREIKFRAWDEKRRELVYFDLNLCNDESREWYNQQIDGNHIMQYTGLKDKNGVEIYEGDIVKVQHYHDRRRYISGFIKFEDCAFLIDLSDIETYISNEKKDIEVIGNIYQNPELLETK